jgi:transcriptional regulator with XRE-family HTH domain
MARKANQIRSNDQARALEQALRVGAFGPADACKVVRSLRGHSQKQFAQQIGLSVKIIKSLESGRGNVGFQWIEKVAAAAGMRIAFIAGSSSVELFDPRERMKQERLRRIADSDAVSSGKFSEAQLHKRNAMSLGDVEYALPELS